MAIYHYDIQQRTEAWDRIRSGIPTASCFSRIVTPKKCELSKSAEGYMDELLAEWMNGGPIIEEEFSSQWMDRGQALEQQAREAYEFITDRAVDLCGFVTTDDGMVGASPDGLVNADSILELKCPKHTTHAHYMRTQQLEDDYYPQLQGLLYVCEREKIDIVSYCPPLPAVILHVNRDEKYIAKMKDALDAFVETLVRAREVMTREYGGVIQRIQQRGFVEAPQVDTLGVSDADVEQILASRR